MKTLKSTLFLVLFLLVTSCTQSQQIGFNYQVKNKEVVFKVILYPGQRIIINYFDDFYGSHQLFSKNNDSVTNSFLCKTQINRETFFKINNVYISGDTTIKYGYNICCYDGDSILIDCTKRPFKIFATRLDEGQLNYSIDSLDVSKKKSNLKKKDCDSTYYLNLQYRLFGLFKEIKDSIAIYRDEGYRKKIKRSPGYIYTFQMQHYSEAINELFTSLNTEKKLDSCYRKVIERFNPYFKDLFSGTVIPVLSEANASALYGFINYCLINRNLELTKKNAFNIIDSVLVGAYNINAKLLFIRNENNIQLKHYYLNKLQQSSKKDTMLYNFINVLAKETPEYIPELDNSNLLINVGTGKSQALKKRFLDGNKKLYLLDFWASWCKPCISEFEQANGFAKKIANNKFSIIYLSIDDDIQKWKIASKKLNLSQTNSFIINPLYKKKFLQQLILQTIPRYILLDHKGRIINYNTPRLDDKELLNIINEYFNNNQTE